ncbi:MAG: ion channel [Methylomonas sp.]|jgi:voltage-gated potassium channel
MNWLTDLNNAMRWGDNLRREIFKSKNLTYLSLLATVITLVVGVVLFIIDPNIKSPMDGIWSAWVTMTHVGFGDVVPVSFFGRLLAAALILVGLVLFALSTALISVALIGKNLDAMGENIKLIEHQTNPAPDHNQQILAELNRLHKRMEALEAMLVKTPANKQSH